MCSHCPLPCCSSTRALLQAFLRFNKLPYERKNCAFGSTPKGRLPFLQHGEDQVADSSLIIDYLENTYGSQLKTQSLSSPADAGLATALRHLAEGEPAVPQRYWEMQSVAWWHGGNASAWPTHLDSCWRPANAHLHHLPMQRTLPADLVERCGVHGHCAPQGCAAGAEEGMLAQTSTGPASITGCGLKRCAPPGW